MTDAEHVRHRDRVSVKLAAFVFLNLICIWCCVKLGVEIVAGLRADASVVGTFDDPGSRCPGRVTYVVDGVRYQLDTGDRGWCSREDGDPTSPQRVFYDSDDPGVAIFADPGGPTAVLIVSTIGFVLLAALPVWLWWALWRRATALLRDRGGLTPG